MSRTAKTSDEFTDFSRFTFIAGRIAKSHRYRMSENGEIEHRLPNGVADDLLPESNEHGQFRARRPFTSTDPRCLGTHQVGIVVPEDREVRLSSGVATRTMQFFLVLGWGDSFHEAREMAEGKLARKGVRS